MSKAWARSALTDSVYATTAAEAPTVTAPRIAKANAPNTKTQSKANNQQTTPLTCHRANTEKLHSVPPTGTKARPRRNGMNNINIATSAYTH